MVYIAMQKGKTNKLIWNSAVIGRQPMVLHWNWNGGDKIKLQTMTNCQQVEPLINENPKE